MQPPGGFGVVHDQVSHSLQIILFGLAGTVVAQFFAAKES